VPADRSSDYCSRTATGPTQEVPGLLSALPQASVATPAEVITLIDRHRLDGQGIGYVDAHLLVAAQLTTDAALWTEDTRLAAAAERLGCGAGPTLGE